MKKFLITLMLSLALATPAMALTFDEGYRELSPNGDLYFSDHKETVFIGGGRCITSANNPNVSCILDNAIRSSRAKIRTSRFFTRVQAVGAYFNK